jgi:predicted Zn finger-like uncharacterized protein
MELTCPSCEARYAVPDGAIGERGRQVSCTNCGYGWHAALPIARSAAAGGSAHPAQHGDRPGQPAGAEIHSLRPSDPSRMTQLAEIRDMIAEVQSDEAGSAAGARDGRYASAVAEREHGYASHAAAPAAGAAATVRPGAEPRPGADVQASGEAVHQDPLRRRMAEHDARAARERSERERLRRSMQHVDGRRPGSGAFLAGFLLVVLVAAAMLAAYVLDDEIIARVPDSEPLVTGYVAGVNDLRISIEEGYERARAWVIGLVGDAA